MNAVFLPSVLLLLSLTPAIFSMVHDAAFSSTPPCPPNPHFSDRSPVFSTKATDDAAVEKTGLPGATALPSTFLHLQLVGRRGRGLWGMGNTESVRCTADSPGPPAHLSHALCSKQIDTRAPSNQRSLGSIAGHPASQASDRPADCRDGEVGGGRCQRKDKTRMATRLRKR